MYKKYNTPILFLIFNRPDLTNLVWKEIAALKPTKLYIAADGPRNSKEEKICKETRLITENIDWECEVNRLYRNTNLGCKEAVSSAITWFFDNVEAGVILEDDCLPNYSFFSFCREMLDYYHNDLSVGHINGSNHLEKGFDVGNDSFYFSKYAHVWGWATWARVWKYYSIFNMSEKYTFSTFFNSFMERVYWWDKFRQTRREKINTWDYQWTYTLWAMGFKTITPSKNTIVNIGINNKATHSSIFNYRVKRYVDKKREDITEMIYPINKEINIDADKSIYARLYNRFFISNIYIVLKFILYGGKN